MTGDIVRGTGLAIVVALILNLIIYSVSSAMGVQLLTITPDQPTPTAIGLMEVIMATIIPLLAAGIVLWLLSLFAKRPITIYQWGAAILILLSLLAPYTQAYDTPTFTALGLMHISSGIAALYILANYVHRWDVRQ